MHRQNVLAFVFVIAGSLSTTAASREQISLDFDWRFTLGNVVGAESTDFDDSSWRPLNVPHDWAFEAEYCETAAQQGPGGFKPGGVGWYRREFNLPEDWHDKLVRVELDGVYMNSTVWLNGQLLGKRPYGYIGFGYDLTPHLQPGRNTFAVRVDNSKEPSARWYHGCGIYGHVYLVATDKLRITPDGVHVTTPEVNDEAAKVSISTTLANANADTPSCTLRTTLLGPSGSVVACSSKFVRLRGSNTTNTTQSLNVSTPQRWGIKTPNLYTAVTEVLVDDSPVDRVETKFGIREVRWEQATGVWLNGENIKVRGVCEHLEGGPVGAANPDALLRWKIELLQQMGCNAIRVSHNPHVPKFYELCDELGMLVVNEAFDGWGPKAKWDYGRQAFDQWWERDLRSFIRRDRNHPCVILWSVGNETEGDVASDLVRVCHEEDPTRLVTSGHAGSEHMDVFGMNGFSESKRFFSQPPADKPFLSTEAPHTWQVRGHYRTKTWYRDGYPNTHQDPWELPDLTDKEVFHNDWTEPDRKRSLRQLYNSSYDNAMVRISARKNWELVRDLPWHSGHFRWTGFDYLGESAWVHGGWPYRLFPSGVIDLAGFPKDLYYFYQSQWTDQPMAHLLPHWTHPQLEVGDVIPVWVYSNTDEVELKLNGMSLGRDRPGLAWNEMQCEWLVPWQPGTLEAIAYRDGVEVARNKQRTAGPPTQLAVSTDAASFAADGRSVSIVTVDLVDSDRMFYPHGENRVTFFTEGPVKLLSLENGDPVDVEPNYGVTTRRAFNGKVRAFLQSTRDSGPVSVVVGAICGEKRQITSNRVAIDVHRIVIRGTNYPAQFDVYYTVDGSTPSRESAAYEGPFNVTLGATVRAAVYQGPRRLFAMEERFAEDEGMYWGNDDEAETAKPLGEQAEDAQITGASVNGAGVGYHGTGYVDFRGGEGAVEWQYENEGPPRIVKFAFRYASNDESGEREMKLCVNGQQGSKLSFKNTGSWGDHWARLETERLIGSGSNRIRLETMGSSGVNLDELFITSLSENSGN